MEEANRKYGALTTKLQAQGKHILWVVELCTALDGHNSWRPPMILHTPDDQGYQKMAGIWYESLVQASNSGAGLMADPVQGLHDDGVRYNEGLCPAGIKDRGSCYIARRLIGRLWLRS